MNKFYKILTYKVTKNMQDLSHFYISSTCCIKASIVVMMDMCMWVNMIALNQPFQLNPLPLLIVKYNIDHCCKNYGFLNKSDNSFDGMQQSFSTHTVHISTVTSQLDCSVSKSMLKSQKFVYINLNSSYINTFFPLCLCY